MLKQKRAGFAQPVIDYMATIIIILIIIIFFILFNISERSYKVNINQQAGNADAGIMLHNLLRVPVEDNGEKIPLAEYLDRINDPRIENTYTAMWPPIMVYLKMLSDSTGCPMRLDISIDGYQLREVTAGSEVTGMCKELSLYYQAEQLLPSMKGTEIIVELAGGVKAG